MGRKMLAIALIALALVTTAQAEERLGGSYFAQTINGGATASIFSASSNTGGASIRTAIIVPSSNSFSTLYATYPDGTQRVILAGNVGTVYSPTQPQIAYPLLLPAGVGLSAAVSGSNAIFYVTYDLH